MGANVPMQIQPDDAPIPETSPEQQRAAARVCAAHARDADDLRLLLRRLGLQPWPAPEPAPVQPTRMAGPRLTADGAVDTCRNGHDMAADNTQWIRNRHGNWEGQCRACRRASQARSRAAKRAAGGRRKVVQGAPVDG